MSATHHSQPAPAWSTGPRAKPVLWSVPPTAASPEPRPYRYVLVTPLSTAASPWPWPRPTPWRCCYGSCRPSAEKVADPTLEQLAHRDMVGCSNRIVQRPLKLVHENDRSTGLPRPGGRSPGCLRAARGCGGTGPSTRLLVPRRKPSRRPPLDWHARRRVPSPKSRKAASTACRPGYAVAEIPNSARGHATGPTTLLARLL